MDALSVPFERHVGIVDGLHQDTVTDLRCFPLNRTELEEDILINKAESVMQLADDPSENTLFLGLRLLLVAGARGRVGHRYLCRLLRVGQAQTGGQSDRGL